MDKTMTGSTSRSVLMTHLCSTWEVSLQTQSGFSRLAAQHGLPTSKALWLRISHQQKFTGTPGGLTTYTSPLLILLLLWLKSPRAISTSSWSKFWTQRSVSFTTLTLNHTSCSATSMQFSKTSTSNYKTIRSPVLTFGSKLSPPTTLSRSSLRPCVNSHSDQTRRTNGCWGSVFWTVTLLTLTLTINSFRFTTTWMRTLSLYQPSILFRWLKLSRHSRGNTLCSKLVSLSC